MQGSLVTLEWTFLPFNFQDCTKGIQAELLYVTHQDSIQNPSTFNVKISFALSNFL